MRIRPRYFVLGLLSLTLVVVLGWRLVQKHPELEFQRQQEVASVIMQHGGGVNWSRRTTLPMKSSIKQRIIGVNCCPETDMHAILDCISQLPDCSSMTVWPQNLTDESVSRLAKMQQIQNIQLTIPLDRPAPLGVILTPIEANAELSDTLAKWLPDKVITRTLFSLYGRF